MATERCYYEILGVERTANGEEIKRAYRRLAMKHHPDRNPGDAKAEVEFKACAEAYEVLADPERRSRYDRLGRAGLRQTPGHDFNSMRADDIFSMFAEIFGGAMGGQGPRGRRGGVARGYDITTEVEIALEDVLRGTTVEVPIQRLDVCTACTGTGAKAGTAPLRCPTCGGHGQVAQSGLGGMFRMVTTCPNCKGRGTVVAEKCVDCRGSGRIRRKRSLSVKLPRGIDDGQVVRVAGEGEPPPPEVSPSGAGVPGDLHVVVRVAEHEEFVREEDDLVTVRPISYTQAVLGATVRVGTLDGDATLEIPPGTEHGSMLRIKGKGLPSLRGGTRGDLVVGVSIRIPTKLNDEQRRLLTELARLEGAEVAKGHKGMWKKLKDSLKG